MHASLNAGFELAVDSTKSLVLPCALFEGVVDAQQACHLALLETLYQVGERVSVCLCLILDSGQ